MVPSTVLFVDVSLPFDRPYLQINYKCKSFCKLDCFIIVFLFINDLKRSSLQGKVSTFYSKICFKNLPPRVNPIKRFSSKFTPSFCKLDHFSEKGEIVYINETV